MKPQNVLFVAAAAAVVVNAQPVSVKVNSEGSEVAATKDSSNDSSYDSSSITVQRCVIM